MDGGREGRMHGAMGGRVVGRAGGRANGRRRPAPQLGMATQSTLGSLPEVVRERARLSKFSERALGSLLRMPAGYGGRGARSGDVLDDAGTRRRRSAAEEGTLGSLPSALLLLSLLLLFLLLLLLLLLLL